MEPSRTTGGNTPNEKNWPLTPHPTTITPNLTYGQKAVGLTFNPSNDQTVQRIKELYAEIIDLLMTIPCGPTSERTRLVKIAITEAQTAQMWAVKAETWFDKE